MQPSFVGLAHICYCPSLGLMLKTAPGAALSRNQWREAVNCVQPAAAIIDWPPGLPGAAAAAAAAAQVAAACALACAAQLELH